MAKYTAEKSIKVYNDTTGEYILVGPDPDTGEAVQITSVVFSGPNNTEEREASIILEGPEQAVAVARAILDLYDTESD